MDGKPAELCEGDSSTHVLLVHTPTGDVEEGRKLRLELLLHQRLGLALSSCQLSCLSLSGDLSDLREKRMRGDLDRNILLTFQKSLK